MNIIRNNLNFNVVDGTPNEEFWKNSGWESETYRVFDQQLKIDKNYLDIGAWIGPTVLYGAQLAKKVYTFEPDPIAWNELSQNMTLNGFSNISAYQFALSNFNGTLKMGSDNRLGESVTRVGDFKAELSFEVECRNFDEWIKALDSKDREDINFVKIDIEGGEVQLAQSQWLRDTQVPILLSIHPPMMSNFKEGIDIIMDLRSYYMSCVFVGGDKAGNEVTTADFQNLNNVYYTVLLT
jgi:FkbM family methyltransferase